MIAGRERFAAPFLPDRVAATARALDEQLPVLRAQGRVAVYVTDDTGIAHIIVAR
jgi:hypothetical protein